MPTVHVVLKDGRRFDVPTASHREADSLLDNLDRGMSTVKFEVEGSIVEIDTSDVRSARVSRR